MEFENFTYDGKEYLSGIYDQDNDIITLIDNSGETKTISPYIVETKYTSNKPLLMTLMKLSTYLKMGNSGKGLINAAINKIIEQNLVEEVKPILEQWCKNSKFMHTLSDELGKLGIDVSSIEYEPSQQVQDILNAMNSKSEEMTSGDIPQEIAKPEDENVDLAPDEPTIDKEEPTMAEPPVSKKETLYNYEIDGKVYKEVKKRTDGVCSIAIDSKDNVTITSQYSWGDEKDRVLGMPLWDAKRFLTFYDINRLEEDKNKFLEHLKFATTIAVTPEEIQNLMTTTEQWISVGGVATKLANEIRQITSKKKDFVVSPENMDTMIFYRNAEICRKDIVDEIEEFKAGKKIGDKYADLRNWKLSKMKTLIEENKGKIAPDKYAQVVRIYNSLVELSKNAKLDKQRKMPDSDYEYKEMVTRYSKQVQSILDEFGNKQLDRNTQEELEFCVEMLKRAEFETEGVSEEVIQEMESKINDTLAFYDTIQYVKKNAPEVEEFKRMYKRLKDEDEEYKYRRRTGLNKEAAEDMKHQLYLIKGALDDVFRYMGREEWIKYSEEFEDMDKYYSFEIQNCEELESKMRAMGF